MENVSGFAQECCQVWPALGTGVSGTCCQSQALCLHSESGPTYPGVRVTFLIHLPNYFTLDTAADAVLSVLNRNPQFLFKWFCYTSNLRSNDEVLITF